MYGFIHQLLKLTPNFKPYVPSKTKQKSASEIAMTIFLKSQISFLSVRFMVIFTPKRTKKIGNEFCEGDFVVLKKEIEGT